MAATAIAIGLWALVAGGGAAPAATSAADAPAAASSADQAAATVARAFGNTLASTYPDGRVSKLWLNPNGGFTGQNRKGEPNAGKWTVSKARLCMKQYKPLFIPFSYCTPIPANPAPDGWPAKAPTGEPIVVRLVKGR